MRIEDLIKQVTGRETVSEPSQSKIAERGKRTVGEKPFQDHRPRSATETLIKNMLKEAGRSMTFREIARGLNRSASPHLRALIMSMVEDGQLIESADTVPNNERMARFWYSLP
jgi:hypothetical protein